MIWPNGAKCAFSLGFDMDGESTWRNKVRDLPNGKNYIKGQSIGAYGPKKGVPHILDILEEFNIKATFFIPALMVKEHAKTVEQILLCGHEISHHGYDHTGFYGNTPEEQKERFKASNDLFVKYAGVRAYGIRQTGALMPETERWLFSEGGFLYTSAGTSGERCGFHIIEGKMTSGVTIPCRDENTDDYVQTVMHNYPHVLPGMPRVASYNCVYDNWICEVEGAIRFGNSGSTAFHPSISGTPGQSVLLRKFCRYLADNQNVWCVPCIDIARYYKAQMEGERL